MKTERNLGKIERVWFGHGGYQDACIGIHFTLCGKNWGVETTRSAWDAEGIKCGSNAKWTEQDRSKQYDEIVRYISKLLKEAAVGNIEELEGKPIEATFEDGRLKEWRILTEVI